MEFIKGQRRIDVDPPDASGFPRKAIARSRAPDLGWALKEIYAFLQGT